MSNHNAILNKFKSTLDEFDIKNPDHRIQVQNKLLFNNLKHFNILYFKLKVNENTNESVRYFK